MSENKQSILDLLLVTLQATRDAWDLQALNFDPKTEIVTAVFESGGKRTINVAMDSGVAMIRDVMRGLGV